MPLQQTSGNVTQDAYGGGAASVPTYVENVFSTYLYTGKGSGFTQQINNGIDLTKDGLVWIKCRSNTYDHVLTGPASMLPYYLSSNNSSSITANSEIYAFRKTGFSVDDGATAPQVNALNQTYASWTFRKQPKFFDIVTYTGTGSAHTIAHNLGVAPGCIIVKRTDSTGDWYVYHSGLNGGTNPEKWYVTLDTTNAQSTSSGTWNYTAPTSTQFSVGGGNTNISGGTYIAYLFGPGGTGGFGLTGTDNVITCGSYTGNGSSTNGPIITLGYEPQFVMVKCTSTIGNWRMFDTMRGMSLTSTSYLQPNLSSAEGTYTTPTGIYPNATGFQVNTADSSANVSGQSYIYIAIRRGPMATPTTGTSVFIPTTDTGNSSTRSFTGYGFPPDLFIQKWRANSYTAGFFDKLRGVSQELDSTSTGAEQNNYNPPNDQLSFDENGITVGSNNLTVLNANAQTEVYWNFGRAPSFFDIVCYTGTGSVGATFNHNLTVVPQLIIIKDRSAGNGWLVYSSTLGNTRSLVLNTNAAQSASNAAYWNNTSPTSTQFTVDGLGGYGPVNASGDKYVAYLFATCSGVSYVGSYTGNGTTQAIACGFTGGARFVLIKRTDSTGNWYVYDTARGMTSGTDPYLSLNLNDAETGTSGSVTTTTGGFTLGVAGALTVNIATASYIFLAIS
jgi:hypothetical protein